MASASCLLKGSHSTCMGTPPHNHGIAVRPCMLNCHADPLPQLGISSPLSDAALPWALQPHAGHALTFKCSWHSLRNPFAAYCCCRAPRPSGAGAVDPTGGNALASLAPCPSETAQVRPAERTRWRHAFLSAIRGTGTHRSTARPGSRPRVARGSSTLHPCIGAKA